MVDLARPPVETVGFCNASTRPLPDSIARAIDLDDERAVAALFACERPDVIINCAGVCLDWLRHRQRRGLPMTVVGDEHRSAVWAEDAARRVWDLARADVTGIRHVTATRPVSRPELATYLDQRFAIGARFAVESRADRRTPHLGRVELATRYRDALAAPLPSAIPPR